MVFKKYREVDIKRGGNMDYTFKLMTQKQAEDIAYNWHYDGRYSFYDMEADKVSIFIQATNGGSYEFLKMNYDVISDV